MDFNEHRLDRRHRVGYGASAKVRKLSVLLIVVSALILLGSLYQPAIRKMWSLQAEKEAKQKALHEQQVLRRRYEEELHALRHDPEAVERAVRQKFRLIKPEETIYRFEPSPSPQR